MIRRAKMTIDYHRLEKGMSLSHPRPGFGVEVANRLLDNLSAYLDQYHADDITSVTTVVLEKYRLFQLERGTLDPDVGSRIEGLSSAKPSPQERCSDDDPSIECGARNDIGGTLRINHHELMERAASSPDNFINTRHSCRQFSSKEVEDIDIDEAIRLAMRSPSVCNRQAWRVHDFPDGELMQNVLKCQNGNVAFREEIRRVLAVTCDARHFVSVGERNQGWIDGGMFAMSLLYGLHCRKLGACALNWSVAKFGDQRLRKVANIPDHEMVIMLIAVGHPPDEYHVAQSPRKPLEVVLSRHHSEAHRS